MWLCGRFTLIDEDWSGILEMFGLDHSDFTYSARYNIAPGQDIPAIVSDGVARKIGLLRWGLIPNWATDAKIGFKTINARAETLLEKPAFKNLIRRKRCLIPADGFYEWKQQGQVKQPMRIVLTKRKVFAFAGLYDTWVASDGTRVSTCTIITTKPNELMAPIHHRMPVILEKGYEDMWVDRSITNPEPLMQILKPYPASEMRAYPVSNLVGNVRNDIPECVEPWASV